MHYEPKCSIMKHRCTKVCISENCNISNPFSCDTCGSHHVNTCQIIEYKDLIKRMHKAQGINRTELFKYEQYVQQTFKTLIKSLQAEFISFREQFQHINASNRVTQFFQLLKSHKENKLTARFVNNILNEKQVLKNKYRLKSQATMWSLSTELIELQKKVNKKLKYYYALYEFDNQNEQIKQVSLDFEEQNQMKQIQMKYRQYRDHLKGSLLQNRITYIQPLFNKQIYNAQILYKASQNDFSAAAFHKACDGKAKTLTIAKTEFGNIVGGYTALPWRSPSSWEYGQDISNQTFIFSLSKSLLGLKFKPYKLKFTIGMHRDYGPCFGDDLVIYDKSNTSKNCWSNFPDCYRCKQKQVEHSERTIREFVGVNDHFKKFNIVQWQVYKISFDTHDQMERSFMEEYRKI